MSNSDSNIFDEQNPASTDAGANPEVGDTNQYQEILSGIVNEEGKQKYNSVEDALKSVPFAQNHIKDLESQVAQLQEQVNNSKSAEAILEEIRNSQAPATKQETPELDKNTVTSLVEQVVNQREVQNTIKANQDSVSSTLKSVYGDKAKEVYESKARELGLTPELLDNLSGRSPKAVLAYFETKASEPSKTSSNINTNAFNHTPEQKPAKSIMGGASTKDMRDAWKRAGEHINQ